MSFHSQSVLACTTLSQWGIKPHPAEGKLTHAHRDFALICQMLKNVEHKSGTTSTVHLCPVRRQTHDLSLPLCLSKSRFPRESKPSPRGIPRPLPPRPPRPPPRPLGGRSPKGLVGNKHSQILIGALKNTCNTHSDQLHIKCSPAMKHMPEHMTFF